MKTTKVEKVITTLKDRIGHPFKEAPYRNPDMSQQPEEISVCIIVFFPFRHNAILTKAINGK